VTTEKSQKSEAFQRCMTIGHIALVAVILVATIWFYFSRYDTVSRDNVEAFIRGFGPWAPIAYAAIYIICAPIPFLAPVFSAVGGLLFGAVRGTLYILVVATLSALVPFSLSRRLGQEWVEGKLKGKKLEDIYQRSEGNRGFVFILLMRLVPVLPWEVQNYVAGLTKVSVPTFVMGTMLGIIPGSFSLAFLGSAASDPMSWQFYTAIVLKVITALVPVVVVYLQNRAKRARAQTPA